MRTAPPELLPIFRSALQARVLAALLLDAGGPLTAADLVSLTGGAPASVHRELTRLERAGLVQHDRVGRTKLYSAGSSASVEPLRRLLEVTLGAKARIRSALQAMPGVEHAAIYGSWATAEAGAASDIDLLVIGPMSRAAVIDGLADVEHVLNREIDVTIFDRTQFERRLTEGSGFLRTVLDGPLIPLVGDPRELA